MHRGTGKQDSRQNQKQPEPSRAAPDSLDCSQAIRRLASSRPPWTLHRENSEGFGFSCVRQDEFLPQSVLQTEVVFLLGRNTTVPGIHSVHEFNMEIHE